MIGFQRRDLKREWMCRRKLQLEESSLNVNKAAEQGEMERKINISSKEMGFLNPISQLDSTVVTYCPMQLKNGEDR